MGKSPRDMSALRPLAVLIVLGGLAGASPPATALVPGDLYAVSGAPGANAFLPGIGNDSWLGGPANLENAVTTSNSHKVSDDGRYVTFISTADGLLAGDEDLYAHVYRQDRDTGTVEQVDVPDAGNLRRGEARYPAISGDGTRIAFATTAQLVWQDSDDDLDVYVRDLAAGTTKLLSIGPDGPSEGTADQPDISRDGTTVAFVATQPFLRPDPGWAETVYTAVVATGTLKLVSRADGADGALPNSDARNPSISADGGAVAWESTASNVDPAVPGPGGGYDVYVRTGDTTLLVSRADGFGGAPGNDISGDPAIAPDGSAVAFTSYASNLDPAATGGKPQVFLRTMATGETSLVSRATGAAGAAADDMSWGPSISKTGAGLTVAFASSAKNLSGATTPDHHAFVRSVATDTTTLVSRLDGPAGDRATVSGVPSIAAGGTAVAFGSDQDDLTTGDDNLFSSVFVREGDTTTWRSRPQTGDLHGGAADADIEPTHGMSADGTRVLFRTAADGLIPGDAAGGRSAAFVRDVRTGAITLASRGDGPDGPIGAAIRAQISADGTTVAFAADEPIGFGTPANVTQTYVRDLSTGHTTLVTTAGGTPADSDATLEAFSADGRYVVFSSSSPVFGVVSPTDQLYRKDLVTGDVVLVSRDPTTGDPLTSVSDAAVSGDGSRVAFTTGDRLAPADTDSVDSVYVRDMAGGRVTLVSHAPDGSGNDASAHSPQISDDGSRVAFESDASNLDGGNPGNTTHGYVADLTAGTVALVSSAPLPYQSTGALALSGDGRRVAWAAFEGVPSTFGVHARDLPTGAVMLVGRGGDGALLEMRPDSIALSRDGGCLAVAGYSLTGPYGYGYPPDPSPHIAGTEPPLDFRYVVLRALDDSCVPLPAVAPPKGGTTTPPPVDRVKPVVSKASLTNRTFRRSAASTAISAAARKRARLGTTLRFTLSETSTVTVRFEQRTTGRKVGRTCRKATRKLRRRKACTRSIKRGMLTRKALKAGANRIAFTGRLGRKALPLGRYRATVVATDAAGNRSTPKRLAFRIVRR